MEDRHGPDATIRRNFRGANILLIDDNPDHCALIQTVLQACMPDVQLFIAGTAEDALGQLKRTADAGEPLPRLVLLDLYLPEREDGWRLLQVLKESTSPYRMIPVTLLSHSGSTDDIQTSYDRGATSYIVKPADYPQWFHYFQTLKNYWWHTVTLPV